jgi:hypothetical protein
MPADSNAVTHGFLLQRDVKEMRYFQIKHRRSSILDGFKAASNFHNHRSNQLLNRSDLIVEIPCIAFYPKFPNNVQYGSDQDLLNHFTPIPDAAVDKRQPIRAI